MNKKDPTFEQAINITNLWINSWSAGEISDEVFAERVGEIIETKEGARGFFVVTLSSDSPLMDRLTDVLISKLIIGGELVVDLVVRNLAMSTAMLVHHQKTNNSQYEIKSEIIKDRCIELLRVLNTNLVKNRIEILYSGIEGIGEDVKFLTKWNYDNEQKIAIKESLDSIANN